MIVRSNGFGVKSESGRNLGSGYKTRAEAVKRLQQVEFFKHKKKSKSGFRSLSK